MAAKGVLTSWCLLARARDFGKWGTVVWWSGGPIPYNYIMKWWSGGLVGGDLVVWWSGCPVVVVWWSGGPLVAILFVS